MPSRKKPGSASGNKARLVTLPGAPRELIVVTQSDAGLRVRGPAMESVSGKSVTSLSKLLEANGATMTPCFGVEERVQRALMTAAPEVAETMPALVNYYFVEAADDKLDKLAEDMMNQSLVEAAYVKPPAYPPVYMELEEAAPRALEVAPPVTNAFMANQLYLEAAPGGIDARYAWLCAGGRGRNVRIVDIEGAWRFTHEDLLQNQGGVIGGVQSSDLGWRNHGTAVVGEFGGDQNNFGVTGISPLANVRAISIFGGGQSWGKAITDAANALRGGDIILIELHAAGPRFNFQGRDDQRGYIAVEFWPDAFAAIVYATQVRGVIVIEAAGNGAENLDDPIYSNRPVTFPLSWRNPFNLANPQSGAILVGAGAPPPGTHGANHGPDRSRLDFSNFGARLDVQGWGREVSTTGYGDLQGGSDENLWYTNRFSGTSSASPIIVGAVASLQGALRAANKPLLTPTITHDLLRNTGSPQQDAPGRPATQRIGNRPDLKSALNSLGIQPIVKLKEAKDVKEKDVKDIKDTKEKEKEKETVKDFKDSKDSSKEGKEVKEAKEKDFKDIKDSAEKVLDKVQDKIKEVFDRPETAAPTSLEERLARLEQTVSQLAHFISGEERPDLQASTLGEEEDLKALSHELEKQAVDAKAAKDHKDIEKLREG
ncbi:MAG: hypothetical protein A2W35_16030 [Chloroflexi bacterium RBG_16_57_11]|nr:MAG: hypothetical protein A2W35_16030 [Chloroflexi bacterium RBG_16_57_11]